MPRRDYTVYAVTDPEARLRQGPPAFRWLAPRIIPLHTRLRLLSRQAGFAQAQDLAGNLLGWTALANLTVFFKDQPRYSAAPMAPARQAASQAAWPGRRQGLVSIYKRLGGVLELLAEELDLEPAALLALWQVEGGGLQGRELVIRFENHLFWRGWGGDHAQVFDCFFQFGTRPPLTGPGCGRAWQCHRFRSQAGAAFRRFHGDQALERQALTLASNLAGEEAALSCASLGGPQILGRNHGLLGYASPTAMHAAFAHDQRAQVLGFFDFCRQRGLFPSLRKLDWLSFARGYNGTGQAPSYARKMEAAWREAQGLLGLIVI